MHFNGVPEIVHHFISKIIHKVYKNLNSKEMTHFKSWKWEHWHEEKNQPVYRWHSNNTGIRGIIPHLTHSKKFALNFWVYKRSSTREDWYQNGDACQYRQILESLTKMAWANVYSCPSTYGVPNHWSKTIRVFINKNLWISGPTLFKFVWFKSHLYV